jgi:hypothetical protein
MTDIEALLLNWQAWGKDKAKYQRCMSLEGNYKPPPIWHAPALKVEVDINSAKALEDLIITLPKKYKEVLAVQYMYSYLLINERFAKTCTIIGISRKAEVWDDYVKQAKIILMNLLTNK